jgi:hypothetical protein
VPHVGFEGHQPFLPHPVDGCEDVVPAAVVVEPHVRHRTALLIGGLRCDPCGGVGLHHVSLLNQPAQPHRRLRVHHDDQRESSCHANLDEQRDVLDQDGFGWCNGDQLCGARRDQRVHDGVELTPSIGVVEDPGRERRPIERPVLGQDGLAELVNYGA